jgi:hypothetical protein
MSGNADFAQTSAAYMSRWRALFLCCWSAAAAVPFLVKYWPGFYGMNHAALVHILRSLRAADSPYADTLRATAGVRAYQAQYYLLDALSSFMTLYSADKVLLAGFFVLVPAAMLWTIRRIAPQRWPNAGLVAPFGSCYMVAAGNVATIAGLLLAAVTVGLLWGRPGGRPVDGDAPPPSWGEVGAATALLWLATFLHPFSMLVAAWMLAMLYGRDLRQPAVLLRCAIVVLPSAIFTAAARAAHSAGSLVDGQTVHASMDMLFNTTLWMLLLGGYDAGENYIRLLLLGLLLAGLLRTMIHHGLRGDSRDARLGRLALLLIVILFTFPFNLHGAVFQHRFAFALPMFAALLADPLGAWSPRRTLIVALTGALASLLMCPLLYRGQSSFTARVEDSLAVAQSIPRGARVLPLRFPAAGKPAQEWLYAAMARDFVTPYYLADGSYYSGTGYRPLTYTQTIGPRFLPGLNPWQHFENVCGGLSVHEPCKVWQKLRHAELVVLGRAYDAVLLLSPPAELVALFKSEYSLIAQKGSVWAFRPNSQSRAGVDLEQSIDILLRPAQAEPAR